MARIQKPRVGQARVAQPRAAAGQNRVAQTRMRMTGGFQPAPRAPSTTTAATRAPAPSFDPRTDPAYQRIEGLLAPGLAATRENVNARQHQLLTEYGLGPATRPGAGAQFDYSNNPHSLAAKLQRNYEMGMSGARNSLAAAGQFNSGAMDRQVRERGNDLLGGRADLASRLASGMLALEGEYTAAQRDVAARLADAIPGAIDRRAANAAPVPDVSRSSAPAAPARPAPLALSKPQPGGKAAGKGKQKIGVGGAQRARRMTMTQRWR